MSDDAQVILFLLFFWWLMNSDSDSRK